MPHPEKIPKTQVFSVRQIGTPLSVMAITSAPCRLGAAWQGYCWPGLLPVQNWSPGLKSDILHGNTGLCLWQGRNLPLHRISVAVAQVLFYHIPTGISIRSFSFFCRSMQRTFRQLSFRFWYICTKKALNFTICIFRFKYHITCRLG